ncbi:cupin [Microgenomates group bacterium RBG_16_45_19]|nr:MAG: cupin [Microgenomates group bacterium RBG_16_45_19]
MAVFTTNIETATLKNSHFRQVLFTGQHQQLVVMSLKPQEEIGAEVHDEVDQFFRLEAGEAKFIVDDQTFTLKADDVIIIPAGSQHNVINPSASEALKLYTIYAPPNHPPGTVHPTKAEADAAEATAHHS